MSNHDLSCPSCRQVDQVQKVSSVVEGGTSTGAFTGTNQSAGYTFGRGGSVTVEGGTTTLTGTSQTQLAQRLALPPKPTFSILSDTGAVLTVILALGGAICLFFGIIGDDPTDGFYIAYWLRLIGIGAIVLAVLWVCLIYRHSVKAHAAVRRTTPVWERAAAIWVRLYYCHRCDGIFVQGRESLYPTKSIKSYLSDVEPVSK